MCRERVWKPCLEVPFWEVALCDVVEQIMRCMTATQRQLSAHGVTDGSCNGLSKRQTQTMSSANLWRMFFSPAAWACSSVMNFAPSLGYRWNCTRRNTD